MTELAPDYWLANPPSQPKKEIADYVESEGFLVPQRFDDIEEAIASVQAGGKIILRSEHRDEYDGPSGLFDSYRIDQARIENGQRKLQDIGDNFDIDSEIPVSHRRGWRTAPPSSPYYRGPGSGDMADIIIGTIPTNPQNAIRRLTILEQHSNFVDYYSMIKGISPQEFMGEAGYSVWEYIPGINVTIVADDAVGGLYHVLAARQKPLHIEGSMSNEGGETLHLAGAAEGNFFDEALRSRLIKQYETIRNLPRFVSNHCPVIELQLDDSGNCWFLQYHRSRDFVASIGLLNDDDFSAKEGWKKAEVVRGAIASPQTLKMSLMYPAGYGETGMPLPDVDEAAAENGGSFKIIEEILARRRIADLADSGFERIYGGMPYNHNSRSRWFKPKTSMTLPYEESLKGSDVRQKVFEIVWRQKKMARVVIDVASDGRTGYFRLNPDSEQPVFTDS